jgi:hypothetical protein
MWLGGKSQKQFADAILNTSLTSQAYISNFAFELNLVPLLAGKDHGEESAADCEGARGGRG